MNKKELTQDNIILSASYNSDTKTEVNNEDMNK